MVTRNHSIADRLYPLFQVACFLVAGFALFSFGWPLLRGILGDRFLDYLSQVKRMVN